ncbi:MAG TPA: YbhB/YbcL family Raf kinase inhibitor-like protein [Acidimicrobiales bacterium]
MAVLALAAALGALGAGLAGCADDGHELRAPSPDQTTTTRPAATTSTDAAADPGATTAAVLQLTSQTFAEGGAIPDLHTCRGDDVSPSLLWTGVPPGTVELAVVVRDLDADGLVHWVVAGLTPDLGGLAQGAVPGSAVEAVNGLGRPGWSGPCPDSGTHHYEFRLYALSQPSGVAPGEPGERAAQRIEATPALATAALSGTSSAPG